MLAFWNYMFSRKTLWPKTLVKRRCGMEYAWAHPAGRKPFCSFLSILGLALLTFVTTTTPWWKVNLGLSGIRVDANLVSNIKDSFQLFIWGNKFWLAGKNALFLFFARWLYFICINFDDDIFVCPRVKIIPVLIYAISAGPRMIEESVSYRIWQLHTWVSTSQKRCFDVASNSQEDGSSVQPWKFSYCYMEILS